MMISSLSLTSLQEEQWRGKIPIQFRMDDADIAMGLHVEPHFLLVSRYSYLYEVTRETIEYFQSKALELTTNVWFECNEVELRHYLPIGILFDLFQHERRKATLPNTEAIKASIEPWTITIHFQKPLKPSINPIPFHESQRLYFHTIKQALHQLLGSSSNFNLLTIDHQTQLWNAINSGDFNSFSTVSQIMLPGLPESIEEIKQVPVRMMIDGGVMRQRLVRPNKPNSSDTSVQSSMRTLYEIIVEDFQISNPENYEIVVHGITLGSIEFTIPIKEFYLIMRNSDFFLYFLLFSR